MDVNEVVVPEQISPDHWEEETTLKGIYTIQYEDTPHDDVQQVNALEPRRTDEVCGRITCEAQQADRHMMATANVPASVKEDTSDNSNVDLRVEELNLFPIETTDKMDEVELKLLDKDFHSMFVKKFSQIGGVKGKATYTKIIYMILDAMFDRKFLLEVSWTGSSKIKGKKKISMLKYKEITSMLFKVINLADSRYTIADNETFFKKVLKNSASRVNNRKGVPKTNLVDISLNTEL
ncbi:hypothetical protein FQR65_LT15388 [Abscondita terminalis]|nr:hypothetical protein FQR65_LT15388 [Abscondita terminalis]